MAKAVFVQNPQSIYDDRPGVAYHFPRQYLGVVRQTVGDWVVFYEGRKGAFGYVAVQRVRDVIPDEGRDGHYFALLDLGTALDFETVARVDPAGRAFEAALRGPDGRPVSGGANTAAVRRLSEAEFAAIVQNGLRPLAGRDAWPRAGTGDVHPDLAPGADPPAHFDHAPLAEIRPETLLSRKLRDAAFARNVKAAYGGRCAISDLALRNGGGRPEVEAAHIRPVEHYGPDTVRNGIALSATLHWMFDRGLLAVADDSDHTILVSENKVPRDVVARLIRPERRLRLPEDPRKRPHPDYLRWHRENVFGRGRNV